MIFLFTIGSWDANLTFEERLNFVVLPNDLRTLSRDMMAHGWVELAEGGGGGGVCMYTRTQSCRNLLELPED